MITLTTEQAQQIEEALVKIADLRNLGKIQPEVIAFETLYVIRAARAQQEELNEWAKDQQHWDKLDGAIAWHMIDRHADNWKEIGAMMDAWLRANAASVLPEQPKKGPVAWYDKIKGMEVSVDVSTGEDDDYHRIFGRVDGVMLQSCGSQEDTILVIEDSRNFAAPVRTKDLTDFGCVPNSNGTTNQRGELLSALEALLEDYIHRVQDAWIEAGGSDISREEVLTNCEPARNAAAAIANMTGATDELP